METCFFHSFSHNAYTKQLASHTNWKQHPKFNQNILNHCITWTSGNFFHAWIVFTNQIPLSHIRLLNKIKQISKKNPPKMDDLNLIHVCFQSKWPFIKGRKSGVDFIVTDSISVCNLFWSIFALHPYKFQLALFCDKRF